MIELTVYLDDTREFVVFDPSGKEVEWIDPVYEFRELSRYWVVHNGAYEYRIYRRKGHTFDIRIRDNI